MRTAAFIFLFLISFSKINAQVVPQEGSKLSYRLIGFSFPATAGVKNYRIEIALGHFTAEPDFEKEIVTRLNTSKNKVIGEVPYFGKKYTWRIVYNSDLKGKTYSRFYHFSTETIPECDTADFRLRIIKNAQTYKGAYVFVDGTRALYDMQGKPVWYLPNFDSFSTADCYPRDMKLTSKGTISVLMHRGVYEIDYNGAILWKMPKKTRRNADSIEFFHHELTRLSSGHYMTMGDEKLRRGISVTGDSNFVFAAMDSTLPRNYTGSDKMSFGTLIEYDDQGNIVWTWKSSDYFKGSDIYFHKTRSGILDVHANAFYFDEKSKAIYVSFKNIDRIVKVKYPEGTVTNVYGAIYNEGMMKGAATETGNSYFCGQHSCRRSASGDLYLFNNNSCQVGGWPSIIVMDEKADSKQGLKKIWEYECDVAYTGIGTKPYSFAIGGNVIELPDHSFLATLAGSVSNVFIVNRNKELLWSAVCEKRNKATQQWTPVLNYRSSIITSRKELENLIWNAEVPPRHIRH